jgi:hypothetical protein
MHFAASRRPRESIRIGAVLVHATDNAAKHFYMCAEFINTRNTAAPCFCRSKL